MMMSFLRPMFREMQINTFKEKLIRKKRAWQGCTNLGTKKIGMREPVVFALRLVTGEVNRSGRSILGWD